LLRVLGPTLRRHREAQGLTIEALAHEAGMSPERLGMIEQGQSKLTALTLRDLAQVLDIPVSALLQEADQDAEHEEAR
jgi:transcriptional regulator with XRE-family HTH domain